jgi:two-component system, chemotaxis family, sensor kinase CheA
MSNSDFDEIVGEFIVESYENLDQLEQAFVSLEQRSDADTLARIFRTIHTIKGTSGFLGFTMLESIAHVGENLLSKLRDGEMAMTTDIANALLAMVDAVRNILASVESTGGEADLAYPDLVDELSRLDRGEERAAAPDNSADNSIDDGADDSVDDSVDDGGFAAPVVAIGFARKAAADAEAADEELAGDPLADAPIGQHFISTGQISEEQLAEALDAQGHGDPRHVGELLVEQQAIASSDVAAALIAQEERHTPADTIRVDVGLLDELMNCVGELVLARNQILRFTETQQDPSFIATSQRLNLITSELQEGVMKTRMQPIENVWNKFPRVVRDLTLSAGKKARLEMEGKSTELDKTLLEAIRDPLTHLVRNAVDHGLEMPE